MKVIWDAKTRLPSIKLEESDFLDASHIQEMMDGQFLCRKCGTNAENNGWKILMGYLESERIVLQEKIKASLDKSTDEGKTRIQVAKLVGFDHFMNLPKRVLLQAQEMKEDLKQKEEANDPNPNPYGF